MKKYQIWFGQGKYALVGGDACDQPILARMGIKIHEFHAASREDAERIKDRAVKFHQSKTKTA